MDPMQYRAPRALELIAQSAATPSACESQSGRAFPRDVRRGVRRKGKAASPTQGTVPSTPAGCWSRPTRLERGAPVSQAIGDVPNMASGAASLAPQVYARSDLGNRVVALLSIYVLSFRFGVGANPTPLTSHPPRMPLTCRSFAAHMRRECAARMRRLHAPPLCRPCAAHMSPVRRSCAARVPHTCNSCAVGGAAWITHRGTSRSRIATIIYTRNSGKHTRCKRPPCLEPGGGAGGAAAPDPFVG